MTRPMTSAALVALMLTLTACGGDDTPTTTTPAADSGSDGSGSGSGDGGSGSGDGSSGDGSSGDGSSGDGSSGDGSGSTQTLEIKTGLDLVVTGGATASLKADIGDATGATVTWEQTAGPSVSLSDVTSLTPSFTAPNVSTSTMLTFTATVDDGASEPASETMSVEVWAPFDQSDNTNLGDFSGNDGWACDVELSIDSAYNEDAQGSNTSISINAIPNHTVGTFPNAGNPNTISEQSYMFEIPLNPTKTNTATDTRIFGVATSGAFFERETAECFNNEQSCEWRYEAITPGVASNAGGTNWAGSRFNWIGTDCNNAHVQPTGNYHYHGLPEALVNELGDAGDKMTMVGHAADGFPIYARWGYTDPNDANSAIVRIKASYEVKSGTRPSGPGGAYSGIFLQDWEYVSGSGDLDECSGRFGVTPEHPEGIYHYYLTDDYPYVPLCVFGQVADNAFTAAPGGPPQ